MTPETQSPQEIVTDLAVVPVEVGLPLVDKVEVKLAVAHSLPRRTAKHAPPVTGELVLVGTLAIADNVALTSGGPLGRLERLLEPDVVFGRVVGHNVDHDLDASGLASGSHGVKVVERANLGISLATSRHRCGPRP